MHIPTENPLGDDNLHSIDTASSKTDLGSPLKRIAHVFEAERETASDVQPEKAASIDVERDGEARSNAWVSFPKMDPSPTNQR